MEWVCVGDVVSGEFDHDFGVDRFGVGGGGVSVFTVFEEEV